MLETILLGGEARPIRFGFSALYEYERLTGRAALADFAEISGGNMRLTVVVDLAVAGLKNADETFSESPKTVADWLGENPDGIEQVMNAFAQSFPKKNEVQSRQTTMKVPKRETRTGTR